MVAVEKLRQDKIELENRLEGKVPVPQDAQGPEFGANETDRKNAKLADIPDPSKAVGPEAP